MSSTSKLKAIKCGMCFNPPTLVLVYNDLDTGKKRKRSMPLRGFDFDTNITTYAAELMRSPKHSKYLSIIPQEQLDSLLQKIKDVHNGKPAPKSPSIHKRTLPHYQSSLVDIPPITPASPSHDSSNKSKNFDTDLDKLLNFDDDRKENKQVSFGSESLEDLLELATDGGLKEKGVKETTQLSDLPGLSKFGGKTLLDDGEGSSVDDPLLGVLKGSTKRPFDDPLHDSAKNSGLGKLPSLGGAQLHSEEKMKESGDDIYKTNTRSSDFEAGHKSYSRVPKTNGDTFATEVPDYSNDFYSESEGDEAGGNRDNGLGVDLEDKSLAISELLEDGDDSSLGLGLRDNKYFSGVKLSGSSSGDDFKRLNDIVTPPQLSDDDTHLLPPLGSQQPGKATGSNGGLLSFNDDDLNKATDEYLAHKKEEMNMLYETNRIKPGDEGYVYDKEIDFDNEPKMESGWDSDDSMSDF